jgi:hypothetical protein
MSTYEDARQVQTVKKKPPVIVTTGTEWIGLAVVIIAAIVVIIVIYVWLKPRIRGGSTYKPAQPPSFSVTCPTSPAPTGLTAFIGDVAKPSFDASWNPVLVPTTSGAVVVGYNVYISKTPGITTANTGLAGFTPVPQVRAINDANGKLKFNTTYYFRVATVDTCGQGALSTEEFQIDT